MNFKLLFFLLLAFTFSCTNEPCEDVDCGEHGTCDEISGNCLCDDFYEGDQCEIEVREKFLGTWQVFGNCSYNPGNLFPLDVIITPGDEINSVKIQSDNILQNFTFTGFLDANGQVNIPEFRAHIGANTHDGTMFVNGGEFNLILNVYVNGNKDTCTYVGG